MWRDPSKVSDAQQAMLIAAFVLMSDELIVSYNDDELKRGDVIEIGLNIFENVENFWDVSSDDIYTFFCARFYNSENVKCLYERDTREVLAVQIYGVEGIAINGIAVGDSIEKVAEVFGMADDHAKLFRNGVMYDNGKDNKLIIYFDDLGLTGKAIEIYFDDGIY